MEYLKKKVTLNPQYIGGGEKEAILKRNKYITFGYQSDCSI